MSALLRSEARKALATSTVSWLLPLTAVVGVVGTLAPLVASSPGTDPLSDDGLQQAMHGAAAGATLVIVAGIVGTAGEWRFGQSTQTFLTTPRRSHVLLAKGLVHLAIGSIYGIAAGVAATAAAWGWYRSNGHTLPLERSAVWLTLLGCLAVSALFGVLGVAIGAIARSQTTAIVGVLGWHVLIEPTLFTASPTVFRWSPGMASFALRRQPSDDFLTAGPAALVLVAFIAALCAAGLRSVERADVTA